MLLKADVSVGKVKYEAAEEYAKSIGAELYETSAKDNTDIEAMFLVRFL